MHEPIERFSDLTAWKVGHKLVLKIYQLTKAFPRDEQFGIISQIRRASSSVTANLAEGFGRYYPKDKVRFYYQARGSLIEVKNFILLSEGLSYIDDRTRDDLLRSADEVGRLINGLIKAVLNLTK